jgi:hypothetical protein
VPPLRPARGAGVPWKSSGVTLLVVRTDGPWEQDHTVTGKRELLASLRPGDRVLAAWTGRWHTDLFELDSVAVAEARAEI